MPFYISVFGTFRTIWSQNSTSKNVSIPLCEDEKHLPLHYSVYHQWELNTQQTLVNWLKFILYWQHCECVKPLARIVLIEDVRVFHHDDITFYFCFSTGCETPGTYKWAHLNPSLSRISIGCSVAFRLVIALIFPHRLGTWTAQLHLRPEMKQRHVSIVSRQEVLHRLPLFPYLYGSRPVLLINTSLSTLRSA